MRRLTRLTQLALLTVGGATIFCPSSALAADGEPPQDSSGAGAAFFISRDNEGFSTQRVAAEYLPAFRHGDALTGGRYTVHHFEQDDWARTAQQLTILHRNVDPATTNGWQLEAGLSRQGEHTLFTADGSYHAALAAQTSVEAFINRDWVETRNALDRGVHFTFVGAVLEQGLGPHLTVVGVAGYQDFSDGNHRNHGRIKLIVQPDLSLGLTLQARYRMYTSASDDVGGAYFNPDRYDEAMLALGWRQRFRGWVGNLTAGLGQQRVGDAPHTPTRLLELGAQAPIGRGYAFRMRAGLNRSASFNGPDYSYHYAQAEWIVAF
ncbi:hypothetical protein ACFQAT_04155 [Undibacterium arcticum]